MKKQVNWLIAAVVFLAWARIAAADTLPPSSTQKADAGECEGPPCRSARTIDVPAGVGKTLRYSTERMSYLTSDHHITILPGERLIFHFDIANGKLSDPIFVRAEAAPVTAIPALTDPKFDKLDKSDPSTFATASQIEDIKANGTAAEKLKGEPTGTLMLTYQAIPGAVGMMLAIEHNFPKTIKFNAFVARPKPEGWKLEYSSTCAVKPGIGSGENWPDPLGMIILENFKLLADTDPQVCE
jgi:hypothetical protein